MSNSESATPVVEKTRIFTAKRVKNVVRAVIVTTVVTIAVVVVAKKLNADGSTAISNIPTV